MRTWQGEMLFAAVVLVNVSLWTTDWSDPPQAAATWISALAVLGTFGHMQVADRMDEFHAQRSGDYVHCRAWLNRYLVGKEVAWLATFVLYGAWPALVGNALFLFYPLWRRVYRRNKPRI